MNAITPLNRLPTSPSWQTDIIILLSRGVSIVEACQITQVSRATYYRRLEKDASFKRQVERVRAIIEIELFQIVRESHDWRAATWLLEKRYPADYGTVRDRLRYARCSCGAASAIVR